MKAIARYSLVFILVFTLTQSIQARVFEGRSVSSRVYEIAFRVRRPFIPPLTDENIEAYFLRRETINEAPFEVPFPFSNRVTNFEQDRLDVLMFDPASESESIIVYLHGGSYVNPPSWIHFRFVTRLMDALEVPVYFPLYPRAPNATVEDALPKLVSFYDHLIEANPHQSIILMGDSAGASLALALTLELAREHRPLPSLLLMISPWLDLALDNPQIAAIQPLDPVLNPPAALYLGNAWRGEVALDDPRVSPLFGDLSVLTMPVMMVMGTFDVLYPDAVLFAQRAQEVGVTLTFEPSPRMLHVYPLFPGLPEGERTIERMLSFIRGEH